MPPSTFTSTMRKSYLSALYRTTMRTLTLYRNHLYRNTKCLDLSTCVRDALIEHLEQMQVQLRWAPQTWIRKLIGLSSALDTPYDRVGCTVDAVFNLLNGYVYIGQTTRNLVTRFWEHIQSALRYQFVLCRGEGGGDEEEAFELYDAMQRLGVEHFLILPIEVTTPERLDAREKYWIRRMGTKVYVIRHTVCHHVGRVA